MKDSAAHVADRFRQFFLLSPGELRDLFSAADHPPLFARNRARFILSRVRMVAMLFAVLTPLWIVVDWLSFPERIALPISVARLLASFAFALLAILCRCQPTPRHSHLALGFLFAIPTLFFLISRMILAHAHLEAMGAAMAVGYAFLPFALVVGLSVFPLTTVETMAFSLPLLAVFMASLALQHQSLLPGLSDLAVLWLLALLAVVSSLASMSQLQLMKGLYQESSVDTLTGLLNRRSGETLLTILFAQAKRYQFELTVAFLDIDDFKWINDHVGHEAGDAVLAQVGTTLIHTVRGGDAIIRWGGDEFLVVMPHTSTEQAQARLLAILRGGALQGQDGRRLTFSAGIAELAVDSATDWEYLVHLADERMYQSKRNGKNRMTAFSVFETNAEQGIMILEQSNGLIGGQEQVVSSSVDDHW